MSDPVPAPRWLPFINLALAVLGTVGVIGGALLAFGGWRGTIDRAIAEQDKRLTVVEQAMPDFYRTQQDVHYLAERARDQDQRQRGRAR